MDTGPFTYTRLISVLQTFDLVPGQNAIAAEFHYEPADANDTVAQSFLTSFIQGDSALPLTIQGDLQSSPFASLAPALSSLTLSTSLQGTPWLSVVPVYPI